MLDVLFVNAPGRKYVYQSLSNEFAASEPPIWAALLGDLTRRQGFDTGILDAEALQLSYEDTASEIAKRAPKLAVFVVYGQQPSASTQSMPAASAVHSLLRDLNPDIKTMFMGTHPSALPKRTLIEEKADFVIQGEGPTTIEKTLKALKAGEKPGPGIESLWYFDEAGAPQSNKPAANIKDISAHMTGMAWDMLPMDRYKAHNWHCWDHINHRQPYASLYTSLGCPYSCSFCCINAPFGGRGIRYFSVEWTLNQIDILVNQYGVKNIKIADEMFVLHPKHVLGICDGIIERGYDLNIWAYARVDTVKDKFLEKMKKAGFNWLALGVESGSKFVRDGVEKGRFGETDIHAIFKKIQDAGIYICANYIFGLPDDTYESMQETLDLSLELNSEWANFYSAMAYPGSPLYKMAVDKNLPLPDNTGAGWIGYSQHAVQTLPLPTDALKAEEVLAFRDYAFDTYFQSQKFQTMMQERFGDDVMKNIHEMMKHTLKRDNAISRSELLSKIPPPKVPLVPSANIGGTATL